MVRMTRNSSLKSEQAEDDAIEEDTVDMDEEGLSKKKGPPPSDSSHEVKVVIAKKDTLSGSFIYSIRHPKNDTPVLYRISDVLCDEIVSVGDKFRSWFFGDSLVSDGSIRMFSPVNPLFIALPYLLRTRAKFVEIDELLKDDDVPAIASLLTNKQLLATLELIADRKDICDTVVYRYNQEKTLEWISGRFDRLKKALVAEGSLHKVISDNDEVLDRYAFGVICDSLCPELVPLSKEHLSITDAPVDDEDRMGLDAPMKRKADDDEYAMMDKPTVKKVKESVVKKQLVQASKGTKNISSFFTKKKV